MGFNYNEIVGYEELKEEYYFNFYSIFNSFIYILNQFKSTKINYFNTYNKQIVKIKNNGVDAYMANRFLILNSEITNYEKKKYDELMRKKK